MTGALIQRCIGVDSMTYGQGYIVFYIGLIGVISIGAIGVIGIVELYLHLQDK